MNDKRAEELSKRPNTVVYKTEYDSVEEPWPVSRVRAVLESLAKRVQEEFPDSVSDFTVRKKCMEDEEVLQFQRRHPNLYWMVTDREKMKDKKYRSVVSGLLEVQSRVEKGVLQKGMEADSSAHQMVANALK